MLMNMHGLFHVCKITAAAIVTITTTTTTAVAAAATAILRYVLKPCFWNIKK